MNNHDLWLPTNKYITAVGAPGVGEQSGGSAVAEACGSDSDHGVSSIEERVVAEASTRMVQSTTAGGPRPGRAVARLTLLRSSARGKPGRDRRQPSTGWDYHGLARMAWLTMSRRGKCTTAEKNGAEHAGCGCRGTD
jgi:hypothetical protein